MIEKLWDFLYSWKEQKAYLYVLKGKIERLVHRILHRLLKGMLWTFAGLLAVVVMAVMLVYVPIVQDAVKELAVKEVSKATGFGMNIGDFRLRFPLELDVRNICVTEECGDTLISVGKLYADARLLPLLRGEVSVSDACVADVYYRMGTRDSSMYLVAGVGQVKVTDAGVDLPGYEISVDDVEVTGADVVLELGNDTVIVTEKEENPMAWLINVNRVRMNGVSYRMSMDDVIDTLSATVKDTELTDAVIDMEKHHIGAGMLNVKVGDISYRYPSITDERLSGEAVSADTVVVSEPWAINVSSIEVDGNSVLYAMAGSSPQSGLDMDYISVSDVYVKVDSFYNCGTDIRVPLRDLRGKERSGVQIDASGLFSMDSAGLRLQDFNAATLFSSLHADAYMGLDAGSRLALSADARMGIPDIELLYPSMCPILTEIPRYNDAVLKAKIDGTLSDVDIHNVSLELPGYVEMSMSGNMRNVTQSDNVSGHIRINGSIEDANFVKPTIMEARMSKQVEIPPIKLDGNMDVNRGDIDGKLVAETGTGRLIMDAEWKGRGDGYGLSLSVDTFPVDTFLPELGVGDVTARVDLSGQGFDITDSKTRIWAEMTVYDVEFKEVRYGNMRMWANVDSCLAEVGVISLNENADLDIVANASVDSVCYEWDVTGDIRNLDLKAMGLSETVAKGSLSLSGNGSVTSGMDSVFADISVRNLEWTMDGLGISTPDINAKVAASDSLTRIELKNNDLSADMEAVCPIDSLMSSFTAAASEFSRQLTTRDIDVSRIQGVLPQFYVDVSSGSNNVLSGMLQSMDMSVGGLDVLINNDSLLTMNASVRKFVAGETRLDNIGFSAFQHSRFMVYRASVDNNPGTMDAFAHVSLNGYVAGNKIGAYFRQRNIKDETGYNLGLVLAMSDSIMSLRFTPFKPVIAYKNWTVNEDNFVEFNVHTRHLDANLSMTGDDSHLKLFTEHSDSLHGQEDVVLNISNLKLADWMAVSPFAPPVKGDISADMRFRWDERTMSGNGEIALDELYFGRNRVGSFLLDAELLTDKKGELQAKTSLMIDSVKTVTVAGTLSDSTAVSPVALDFTVIRFPLKVVNPFLPPGTVKLSGVLNGEMDVSGRLSSPMFNGYVDFDSASVAVDMIGSAFRFSDAKIPVEENVIRFSDYSISGANNNPLYVNGNIDIAGLSPEIDLSMKARNMQFIGSSRGKRIDVYGKGFIDVDASVKGNMDLMKVNTVLNLLPGSNITYIMADAVTSITSQSTGDMVKFVRFDDEGAGIEGDTVQSGGMSMDLDAMLIVSSGTTVNVDLSTDGKNKVQLQGSGTLNYTMNDMADSRITGRYTIDKGFVRYTPPLMSEKHFDFVEGSYVAFNGDILNPILNISAVDNIRANVTREGHDSRLVNFDVSLSVTNTLSNMNVAFDLSTPDDLTIQNELQSMSAEQRANQAMNMLLYNVYTGPGTKADGNMAGNPLFSILESRINTWAANNIKFVDISFGIDRYDNTTDGETSTATSYSYKVSKTLFNDRFKIVVGGNYSTDADSDENFSQNLINDISFEYMLNRSGSMFVRIFRHVGYESILEGEVTQTGVGFVYKRKIHSLKDLFRGYRRNEPVLPVVNAESKEKDEE